ncbi:MAG: hypothetical protein JWQ83_1846 [Lacunisphaera sp.]|nr:hypothetical protein [Lacunisphaera sp.]
MNSPGRTAGFTLLELLVVIGLIAGLSFVLISGLGGGGKSAALQSAQATLANLLMAARMKAMATGQPARVLVQIDPASPDASSRYLRYLVLQVANGGNWDTQTDAYLPDGVGLLPRDIATPANLMAPGKTWTRPSDGSALRSTALRAVIVSFPDAEVALAINSSTTERWAAIKFTAAGTTQNSSDLILASLVRLAPATFQAGESPVQFDNPDNVRGLSLSSYGVPTLINSRASY